jgi:predicted Zn-dependent protease
MRAHRGQEAFAAAVTLTEATDQGSAPCFQPDGFVKPATVELVRSGHLGATLVSPRTAAEYQLPANGANDWEVPESLVMAGGELADNQVLGELETGIYISDLHYLNYSDRQACRVTGMTRFACFWVENGELAAPIEVMRFDDSLLRMLGSGLVALTRGQRRVPDTASYGERHLGSITAPGAIVEGLRFTL